MQCNQPESRCRCDCQRFCVLCQGEHQVRLVKHALEERARMLRNAPFLTGRIEFVVPCFSRFEQFYYGAGLKLYDWIAGRTSLSPSRLLARDEALRRMPVLKSKGLAGAVSYADGQFDDARYALSILHSFSDAGGEALNYARVAAFEKDSAGLLTGAVVEDQTSSLRFPIFGIDVIGVPNDRDPAEVRCHLVKKLQALGGKIGGNKGDTRDIAARTGDACH